MKKTTKFLTVILVLGMMIGIFSALGITVGAAEEGYSGTPATPPTVNADNYIQFGLSAEDWNQYDGYYAISNAEELYGFADIVNKRDQSGTGACAILVNDIVVNAGTVTSAGSSTGTTYNWTPIAKNFNNDYNYYKGTFDGRGYTISGLYAGDATVKPVGLFGALGQSGAKATVKNLTIANSYFAGESCVGAIAGHVQGATIANCKVASDVTVSAEDGVGGIAGAVAWARMINITSCVNLGKVVGGETGGRNVGAILGNTMENSSTYLKISDCYYIEGNTTANGESLAGVGNNMSSADNGTKSITSVSDEHTCVGIEHSEVAATCQASGSKGYTECMICGTVMSGEKGAIPIGDHAYNSSGECIVCGLQAVASLTNGSTVTYYATLEEAITEARSATNSTVTLLDDCSPATGYWFTISDGKFTLDLNGKQITVANSTYSAIVVESGNITLKDSVGGGGSNGGAHVRGDGTLRVEGGTYGGSVSTTNGNLIVVGGSFAVVSLDYDANPGTISLMGGDIAKLQVYAQAGGKKMADVIVRDYYLADENGVLIDPDDAQLSSSSFYYLENVTVQRGADLSANAVVTVENAIYNGSSQTPVVTVTVMGTELMLGVDFSYTYPDGYDITSAGTTTLTIKAIGTYYTGETTATYTIEKATLTEDSFTFDTLDFTYNFDPQSVSVNLPTGLDPQYVTVGYMKDGSPISGAPEDAGEYKVVVSVVGSPNHYDALFTYDMTIAPAPVEVEIAEVGAEFFYNGNSHEPQVIVTMNGGLPFIPTDFGGTVSYENNYDVGTANVIVGGNYTGSCTFVIQKGNPTITAEAPIDMVMPGYSLTLTGVTDAIDNFFYPTEFSILPGEGYTFDGMTVTISDGVVYGSTIVVNIASTETRSYNAAVGTLALTVGVPVADTSELNNKITGLENTLKELEEKYGADVSDLDRAIEDLKAQVGALDENGYATDTELADAIVKVNEAITGIDTRIQNLENTYATKDALEAAKAELNAAIVLKADTATLNEKVEALEKAIADAEAAAKKYADDQDAALKAELEATIEGAKAEITNGYTAAVNAAKAELNAAIVLKADTATLNEKVEALEKAIADAEAAAKKYADDQDAALKAELDRAISDAKDAAVKYTDDVLKAAKEELNKAITDGDSALDQKIENLNTALENAKSALEAADEANKQALLQEIDSAEDALKIAINKVAGNLDKAKKELSDAISAGDTELEGMIAELDRALEDAKAALEAADGENREALEAAIADGDKALDEAINNVAKKLSELEKKLEAKDTELTETTKALTTALIVVGVFGCLGFAGSAGLIVWTVVARQSAITGKKKD